MKDSTNLGLVLNCNALRDEFDGVREAPNRNTLKNFAVAFKKIYLIIARRNNTDK